MRRFLTISYRDLSDQNWGQAAVGLALSAVASSAACFLFRIGANPDDIKHVTDLAREAVAMGTEEGTHIAIEQVLIAKSLSNALGLVTVMVGASAVGAAVAVGSVCPPARRAWRRLVGGPTP